MAKTNIPTTRQFVTVSFTLTVSEAERIVNWVAEAKTLGLTLQSWGDMESDLAERVSSEIYGACDWAKAHGGADF